MLISARTKWSLRAIALLYLLLLLLLPVVVVFFKTFEHGFGVAWGYMTTPAAISALWLSLLMAAIAVPLNTIFGIGCALVLVRRRGRAAAVLDALIDLPFLVSPIVIGLALTLVYGIHGWFGTFFSDHGVRIIYALPGMVLATIFVSLPFVVREVAPVLREVGDEQEQAAATLGASSLADVLADHAALDPLGRGLRRDPFHGARAGRDRRGARRLLAGRRPDADAAAARLLAQRPGPRRGRNHLGLRSGDRAGRHLAGGTARDDRSFTPETRDQMRIDITPSPSTSGTSPHCRTSRSRCRRAR